MESKQFVYLSIGVLILGVIMLFMSKKQRNEKGEWGNYLQWGYLLIMVGVFGFMATALDWSFTAILLTFTAFTGIVWLWSKLSHKNKDNQLDDNHFRDYMSGFFPIILVVFLLRTFIAEPFQIPSSSMRPGLVKGDFILVNKFVYGIRIPVLNNVLFPIGEIKRGDVVVFNYPVNPKQNYIKRIVGVSGDIIEYKDKILTVNGKEEQDNLIGTYQYPSDTYNRMLSAKRFHTQFDDRQFEVLKEDNNTSVDIGTLLKYQDDMSKINFKSGLKEYCQYEEDGSGFKCTVPKGKYFAMGDNRDSSADSRYWGFIDDNLIVGKAFFIWMNFGDMKRIGSSIH